MPLVEVSHLVKQFTRGGGFLHRGTAITAVDDVSFEIEEGETFGLVGESGSGKTTTGRCLLRLIEPTSGSVRFAGEDVLALSAGGLRRARRRMCSLSAIACGTSMARVISASTNTGSSVPSLPSVNENSAGSPLVTSRNGNPSA